ncbi:LysR family transcriptional regulator [Streptomyces sp. 8L]|uniref:LysR family transcriptional regulator n=1 Tax=unclassified Streptomyces TaxID=2593676 RepID=UPI001CD2D775|nr:LysR family transcriptional regulator [Streptomyces sp. 8L]MCA1220820.1 LysR family transcriptional regulator [Streptomyces sp. 8L]
MLDIRRLQVFVAVAEEGSFTAAAQRLFLTQSAVSQQVAALERELGTPLLRRLARGVRPTAAGEVLADRSRHLFGRIASVEQEVRAVGGGPHEISLGAFATAGVELLPLALRTFRTRHPDIRVALTSVHADGPPAGLREGRLHALLTWEYDVAPQPAEPGLVQRHLPDDPLRVLLPVDHPLAARDEIALAELAAERWVVRGHRPPYAEAHETMCRIAGFEPAIAFRTEDYQSLQGLVAAGMGVGLAPALSLFPRRDDVRVLRLASPVFARRVTALTLDEPEPGTPVRDLLDILCTTAEELLPGS